MTSNYGTRDNFGMYANSSTGPGPALNTPFDPGLCFVRLRKVRGDGFVEFDFAIGEPDLSVELVMPVAAFHEFCHANHVRQIAPVQGVTIAGESAPDSGSGA